MKNDEYIILGCVRRTNILHSPSQIKSICTVYIYSKIVILFLQPSRNHFPSGCGESGCAHHYLGGWVSDCVYWCATVWPDNFSIVLNGNLHANRLTLNTSKHWLIVSVVGYKIVVMRCLSPLLLFRCGGKCWQCKYLDNLNYWTWEKNENRQEKFIVSCEWMTTTNWSI